jgi:hypothetical protein
MKTCPHPAGFSFVYFHDPELDHDKTKMLLDQLSARKKAERLTFLSKFAIIEPLYSLFVFHAVVSRSLLHGTKIV